MVGWQAVAPAHWRRLNAMPTLARPKRKPDPNGKRSKARARGLQERKDQLPAHLQQEFEDLQDEQEEPAKEDSAPVKISEDQWTQAAETVDTYAPR